MADLNLEAAPFLGGYARDFGTVHLREETGLYLRSIAIPLGGETAAAAAVKKALGVDLPAAGVTVTGKARVLATAADQYLAISDGPAALDKLGDAVYVTDQSDVWSALTIDGPGSRSALERLCPLDLDPEVFAEGATARTVMEHMGAMIIRTGPDAFLLLVSSSYAASFLHAVETSVVYTT